MLTLRTLKEQTFVSTLWAAGQKDGDTCRDGFSASSDLH
ncbi:rCG40856 [Rattus norvegicus]|uniref:RCG40856 n=1 Tax=Rattus norvegicus TaxID=10116 RepID=A6KL44_RAT|nr:rCG40856 [Rattus norvegicus]